MTPEQHAEIMRMLTGLAKQGQALRRELSKLAREVDSIKSLVGDLEPLLHSVLQRFDEL